MAKDSSFLINLGQGLHMVMGLPTIVSWETSQRPKKAKRGTFGFNTQTQSLEYYNGSYWLEAKMED